MADRKTCNVRQAAARTGYSVRSIYNMLTDGRIESLQTERGRRIYVDTLPESKLVTIVDGPEEPEC